MGWSFRRSKKIGPFRLNLSKKGVGWSVGNRYNRLTVSADGRTTKTTSLPFLGLSKRETISSGTRSSSGSRSRPTSGHGCLTLVLGSLALVAIVKIGQAVGPAGVVGFLILGVVVIILRSVKTKQEEQERIELARRQLQESFDSLVSRFGEDAAHRIAAGEPWQGASQEMIREMLGPPLDIAVKVHKTKTVETWKYRQLAKNRFGLKITFENGTCTGWETN